MKRRRISLAAIAIVLVCVVAPGRADSEEQEVAEPIIAQPQRLEVVEPAAPRIRMLAPDALLYLEQLRQEAAARKAAGEDRSGPADESVAGGGVSRKYTVDEPSVVNPTNEFRFRDVTARQRPIRPVLTMEQRRAVVEAFRRKAARTEDGRNRERRD